MHTSWRAIKQALRSSRHCDQAGTAIKQALRSSSTASQMRQAEGDER
ncbi:hypothetical protein [Paenibacillus sp. LHD-38]|nr:hypothetical protein [Paenibacillus sp. LHD-38]MDQ8738845.1 hypothetical protein [Paenibacillus sp. LHD-38]